MLRIWKLVGLTMFLAAGLCADTIAITHTGVGSGQIGASTFTNAAFTITDFGNTLDRMSFAGGFFINDTSASINIVGVGTFNFLTGTRTFVNNSTSVVGFARAGVSGGDLFDGPTNAASFFTWDMLSSIGPTSGTGTIQSSWTSSPVNTDGGVLTFNSGSSDTVFTATVGAGSLGTPVPEPSTLVPLGISLIGIVGMALRRRRVARTSVD